MRHSPMWIAGRVGILIVFGIMPLARIAGHHGAVSLTAYDFHKYDKFNEYADACHSNYDICWQHPGDSEHKAAGDFWLGKMQDELRRIHNTNSTSEK